MFFNKLLIYDAAIHTVWAEEIVSALIDKMFGNRGGSQGRLPPAIRRVPPSLRPPYCRDRKTTTANQCDTFRKAGRSLPYLAALSLAGRREP